MSYLSKIPETFVVPLLTGALSGAGTMVFAPEIQSVRLPFVNYDMNGILGVAVSAGVGNLIGNIASSYILPMLNTSRAFQMVIPPLATAGATAGFLAIGNEGNIGKLALVAGGSAAAADYIFKNFMTGMGKM